MGTVGAQYPRPPGRASAAILPADAPNRKGDAVSKRHAYFDILSDKTPKCKRPCKGEGSECGGILVGTHCRCVSCFQLNLDAMRVDLETKGGVVVATDYPRIANPAHWETAADVVRAELQDTAALLMFERLWSTLAHTARDLSHLQREQKETGA